MADECEVAFDLSSDAIFNDLEWPPNSHFKVTSICDTEYVTSGIQDSCSYLRSQNKARILRVFSRKTQIRVL